MSYRVSPFVSRVLVTLILLPIVLGIVWAGGWWLFALALVGGLLALHELYGIARGLHPMVLGGYAGLVLTLLGAQLGGPAVAPRRHPLDAARSRSSRSSSRASARMPSQPSRRHSWASHGSAADWRTSCSSATSPTTDGC